VFDAPEPAQLSALIARSRRGACLFADVPAGPYAPPPAHGDAHYTYLALPAHWHAGVLERQLRGFAMASFSGCVVTGGDLATELSPVISQVVQSGLGIAFLSSGRDISTGIETADPLAIASGILRETSGDRTNGRLAATA
jgi:flagellar biosynthesis GTPase FlhF